MPERSPPKLSELIDHLVVYGADLRLARVKPDVLALLRRDGVIEKLGEDKVFGNVYHAAEDQLDP